MTLVQVGFRIGGEQPYLRAFELMGSEAADLTEPLTDAGDVILESVGQQFASEGAHGGGRWAPLSSAYARWKEANFPGRPLLVRTAAMRQAAVSRRALRITPQRLLYEVDSDYAIYHQEGRGHQPARKLVALSTSDRRAIDRSFVEWVNHMRRGVIGR